MAPRDFVSLYAQVDAPHASPHRVSSTGLNIFRSMPSLLPRKITSANSVIRVDAQRPSPSDHRVGIFKSSNEATPRFTCVTACCFANWELTTPDCSDAAPLNYRDERITSRAGLEPARYSTVTAYGPACIVAKLAARRSSGDNLLHLPASFCYKPYPPNTTALRYITPSSTLRMQPALCTRGEIRFPAARRVLAPDRAVFFLQE